LNLRPKAYESSAHSYFVLYSSGPNVKIII
jgi:hypothetical protein